MKYVLVSGGVISGIGKGVIGITREVINWKVSRLIAENSLFHWSALEDYWPQAQVSSIKIDPYMNVDAGTMAPKEHGECFVLDDGGEVDLDLGNYERYLNVTLTKENNITTGKIYQQVINDERKGKYLGRTVQVVPHVTDAIVEWIERVSRIPIDDTAEEPDICIIELGGTVGDIESAPFIEAMRTLRRQAGKNNFLQIHVSLVPVIGDEQKTKPTQQAIRDVRSAGLSPDLIACRCERKLEPATVNKIAHWCQVDLEQVLAVHDLASTYHVPLLLEQQGLITSLSAILSLSTMTIKSSHSERGKRMWREWRTLTNAQDRLFDKVSIALVGKYTSLHDSYLSVEKSLQHAAMHCHRMLELIWVDAEHLEDHTQRSDPAKFHKAWHEVCTADGVIVPGGFGLRGTEGMISAARWARENRKPYLGICLGMQLAVIEFARTVCGLSDASSKEFREERGLSKSDDVANEVIIHMADIDQEVLGGTMRRGLHATVFQPGSDRSILRELYQNSKQASTGASHAVQSPAEIVPRKPLSLVTNVNGDGPALPTSILERHRHRYEVNPDFIDTLMAHGLLFTGKDEIGKRMEICELPQDEHPFYVSVQYHPEYLSRVLEPSRPYLGFVAASAGIYEDVLQQVVDGHGNIDAKDFAAQLPRRQTINAAKTPSIPTAPITKNGYI
ncbi:MAG: hypothetical protein Q9162_006611 [Coniocarpon cinnabarinum]